MSFKQMPSTTQQRWIAERRLHAYALLWFVAVLGCGTDDCKLTAGLALPLGLDAPSGTGDRPTLPGFEASIGLPAVCIQGGATYIAGGDSEPILLVTAMWDIGTMSALWTYLTPYPEAGTHGDLTLVLAPEAGVWSWRGAPGRTGHAMGIRLGVGRALPGRSDDDAVFLEYRWVALMGTSGHKDGNLHVLGLRYTW